MKIAATHSYSAVPSMLIVAPSGRQKLVTRSETPEFSRVHFMLSGRVADDEADENAVRIAGAMARNWATGLTPARNLRMIGKVTNTWKDSASTTAIKNLSNGSKASNPVEAMVSATRPKTPMGAKPMIHMVIFIMVSETPVQKLSRVAAGPSGIRDMKKPKTRLKKIRPSISP